MRTPLLTFLLILCWLAMPVRAEIVVVVHPESPLQKLTIKEISDLYLGRSQTVSTSERLLVLDQPRDSELRERFFKQLNGMDLRRVNAYWARLQFSGDTQPPANLPDSQSIVDIVRRNRFAIGYVDSAFITGAVRGILTLKE